MVSRCLTGQPMSDQSGQPMSDQSGQPMSDDQSGQPMSESGQPMSDQHLVCAALLDLHCAFLSNLTISVNFCQIRNARPAPGPRSPVRSPSCVSVKLDRFCQNLTDTVKIRRIWQLVGTALLHPRAGVNACCWVRGGCGSWRAR